VRLWQQSQKGHPERERPEMGLPEGTVLSKDGPEREVSSGNCWWGWLWGAWGSSGDTGAGLGAFSSVG
jgi:hypothetical protein